MGIGRGIIPALKVENAIRISLYSWWLNVVDQGIEYDGFNDDEYVDQMELVEALQARARKARAARQFANEREPRQKRGSRYPLSHEDIGLGKGFLDGVPAEGVTSKQKPSNKDDTRVRCSPKQKQRNAL